MSKSKCGKSKNPCKICFAPVSQKNGLQCHGECKSWIHYSCLNYTPGRIKDIKAGIIKVTCPCPDCKSSQRKEYRTDEPFSCTNLKCPANRTPMCENTDCPIVEAHKSNQTSVCAMPPLAKCDKKDCKEFSIPISQPPCPRPVCPPPPPVCPPPPPPCPPPKPPCPPHKLPPPPCPPPISCPPTPKANSSTTTNQTDSSECSCIPPSGPPHPPPASSGVGDIQFPMRTVEQMCNTVGQLTCQINDLMSKMKEAVTAAGGGGRGGGGCNHGGGGVAAFYAQHETGGGGAAASCPHQGAPSCGHQGGGGGHQNQKSMCPKPCFCPGNPARK